MDKARPSQASARSSRYDSLATHRALRGIDRSRRCVKRHTSSARITFGISFWWIFDAASWSKRRSRRCSDPARRASLAARRPRNASSRDGPFEQSIKQRAQIESGATRNHGQTPPGRDIGDCRAGQAGVLSGRKNFVRIGNIQQMVRNATTLFGRQFGGTDSEMAVNLQRIAVDYLAAERSSYFERQGAFSRPGRAGDRNQRGRGHVTGYRENSTGLMGIRGHGRGFCGDPGRLELYAVILW